MKILYNKQYGGFSISTFAALKLIELKNLPICIYESDRDENNVRIYKKATLENCTNRALSGCGLFLRRDYGDTLTERKVDAEQFERASWDEIPFFDSYKLRFDPVLIKLFEEYGSERISGDSCTLALTEIPKGNFFTIDDYDGNEHVNEYYPGDRVFYAYE